MTTKEEGNRLIGEFMGLKYSKKGTTASFGAKWCPYRLSDIHYDTSWNWLMPVVEKIRNSVTGCIVTMIDSYGYNECLITDNWPDSLNIKITNRDTLLQATYAAIIEFLTYFNKGKDENHS